MNVPWTRLELLVHILQPKVEAHQLGRDVRVTRDNDGMRFGLDRWPRGDRAARARIRRHEYSVQYSGSWRNIRCSQRASIQVTGQQQERCHATTRCRILPAKSEPAARLAGYPKP
jgi:hypothetical protein